MKTCILVILAICINITVITVEAQTLRYSRSQPYTSLSAYSGRQLDALSFTGNQAVLAQVKHWGAGIFGERRFMLKETSTYTLGASIPSRLGNFGVQFNYGGFQNFSELRFGFAYARKLGRTVDAGVQFNYYSFKVPGYGNASALNFEAGVLLHPFESLHIGLHVHNPVGGKLGKDKEEKLASIYKAGLGYDASQQFFISTEVIKEEDKPVNITAGLQYQFARQFFARAGIITESTTIYAGAGIAWKMLRLDISSGYHPELGVSPGVLLLYNFKPGEK